MITNSLNSLICNFDKYDERFMSASIILNSKYGIFYAKAKDRSLNQVLDQVGKKLIKQITRKKAQTESFSQPDIQIEESNI